MASTPPPGYAVRGAMRDDLDGVRALLDAYDTWDVGRPDTAIEHVVDDWESPSLDMERDTFVVMSADGSMAAYGLSAHVPADPGVDGWGIVHPEHRARGVGSFLVDLVVGRAVEMAAEREPPRVLRYFVSANDTAASSLLDRRRFEPVRRMLHLERALGVETAPSPPPGVTIRRFRDADGRAVHAALEEAFAEHWGIAPTAFETWQAEVLDRPSFRPELVLLAEADGELVGVLIEKDTQDAGWIDELGVRPRWRGMGIAAALMQQALADLAGRGHVQARLNVDAGNDSGALQLYERVGMRVRRTWLVYEKPLAG
ncbi:MAG TPA: GNAT family N-acetyltransferase [Actinomycetota bacterium]